MNLRYLVFRLLHSILTILIVSVVVFVLLRVAPGDPAVLMLGDGATETQIRAFRQDLGLDRPLHEQYVRYALSLLRGDWGTSIRAQRPALEYVLERFGATLELAVTAMGFTLLVGIPVGVVSAARPHSRADLLARGLAFFGQSTPGFWLGLMLITVFSVQFQLLPASGRGSVVHLVLPGVTLGVYLIGFVIRLVRSEMLEVLDAEYVRTARAKGVGERWVVFKHALRNAALPVVTVLGLQLGVLLGGAVITESVFAWPGMGLLALQAIYQRDYPVVQVVVLLSALIFVMINLIIDMLYSLIDPRIRYE